MSPSDRERAEGFRGGAVEDIATLEELFYNLETAKCFGGVTVEAIAKLPGMKNSSNRS